MTKKKITRKVSWAISLGWLFYITIKFLIGKADTFSTICMFVCYSLWALYLIPNIVLKITQNIQKYKIYKSLVNVFEYLQAIHKERYKLYFTGDNRKKNRRILCWNRRIWKCYTRRLQRNYYKEFIK